MLPFGHRVGKKIAKSISTANNPAFAIPRAHSMADFRSAWRRNSGGPGVLSSLAQPVEQGLC